MVGCISRMAFGIPKFLDCTIRTKSFSKAALPKASVAEALLIVGSAVEAVETVPIETEIGCDGD